MGLFLPHGGISEKSGFFLRPSPPSPLSRRRGGAKKIFFAFSSFNKKGRANNAYFFLVPLSHWERG
jgi:hypothetical protein